MNVSDGFSIEEWATLAILPRLVALGASRADGSRLIANLRESRAGERAIDSGMTQFAHSALIVELLETRDLDAGARIDPRLANPANIARDEDAAAVAVSTAYAVAEALAKATPEDAEAYREWIMSIANAVVKASSDEDKDGKKVAVNELERKFIARLLEALGA